MQITPIELIQILNAVVPPRTAEPQPETSERMERCVKAINETLERHNVGIQASEIETAVRVLREKFQQRDDCIEEIRQLCKDHKIETHWQTSRLVQGELGRAYAAGMNKAAESYAIDRAQLEQELKRKQTSWNLPKKGDRLKVIKEPPTEVNPYLKVGEIITIECVCGCSSNPANSNAHWTQTSVGAVAYMNGLCRLCPLDCLEPA